MYETLPYPPIEIFATYIVVLSACALVFPVLNVIISAIRGAARWR